MNKFKELCLKIFKLKTGASLAVILTSMPLVLTTAFFEFPDAVDYVLYLYSAYGFVVLIYFFIYDIPRFGKFVKRKIAEIPVVGKYLSDMLFMARFAIYQGLVMNTTFAVFKIFSSVIYRSKWLGSIGVYYIMLSAMRLILIRSMRKYGGEENHIHEIKSYRLCGLLMLALNGTMIGMIIQMVTENKGYEYAGWFIYVNALFAFYSFIMAFINLIKFRRMHKLIISASKILTFAGALMSMMNLTTAMLNSFGGDRQFRQIMTTCVGAGVSIITVGMSAYMIVRSNKMLKNINNEKEYSNG